MIWGGRGVGGGDERVGSAWRDFAVGNIVLPQTRGKLVLGYYAIK